MKTAPLPSEPRVRTSAPEVAGVPGRVPTRVPIRSLGSRHRKRITTHLQALGERDRYLRFGYPATDAQIAHYVDTLRFETDEVFGIFSRRLELIALAHLAYAGAPLTGEAPMAEFGVSVLQRARGRGFGHRLFAHATLHARNRGIGLLFIHALSENAVMLKIARRAGAIVEREGSESQAWLKLPPDNLASHVDELVETQVAEFDYRLKVHARRVNRLLGALAGVGVTAGAAAGPPAEPGAIDD